jgi:Lrp/AsnC family leucine-responsive transcriptional regulator
MSLSISPAADPILLDRIDRHILERLQADGRITNAALAAEVALSPSACLARVRRLEEAGIITGYRASIAVERVRPATLIHAEVSLGRHQSEDFAAVEALFGSDPRVIEADEISGQSDYQVKVLVRSMAEWRDLTARWTAADSPIARVTSSVAMHQTKPFAGFPVD